MSPPSRSPQLPSKPPPKARRIHLPPWPVVRIFVLGAAAVVAAIWGLVRHYSHELPPMVVPVPAASASDGTDVEIEVDLSVDGGEVRFPIELSDD